MQVVFAPLLDSRLRGNKIWLGMRDDNNGMVQVSNPDGAQSAVMGGGDKNRGYVAVHTLDGKKATVIGADEKRGNYIALQQVGSNKSVVLRGEIWKDPVEADSRDDDK